DAALTQLALQSPHRQIRRRRKPRQKPVPFRQQDQAPPATHRLGSAGAGCALSLTPANHARYPHLEKLRHLVTRLASRNQSHRALPKVARIGSCHACWPPTPASSLNQISRPLGIPYRFTSTRSRSSLPLPQGERGWNSADLIPCPVGA